MGSNGICAILMCHGEQVRMEGFESPKQLVLVNGEPCVRRTVRLLREQAPRCLVRIVAPETDLWSGVAQMEDAALFPTTDSLFLAALPGVIPNAGPFDKFLVLCGDVVFSPDILRRLIEAESPVAFAGRFVPNLYTGRPAGELYGFAVRSSFRDRFIETVRGMVASVAEMRAQVEAADPKQVEAVMEKNLRLWLLLHTLEDEGDTTMIECAWTDYIDDIDGLDDLERLPKIEEAISRQEAVRDRCAH